MRVITLSILDGVVWTRSAAAAQATLSRAAVENARSHFLAALHGSQHQARPCLPCAWSCMVVRATPDPVLQLQRRAKPVRRKCLHSRLNTHPCTRTQMLPLEPPSYILCPPRRMFCMWVPAGPRQWRAAPQAQRFAATRFAQRAAMLRPIHLCMRHLHGWTSLGGRPNLPS